MINDWPNLGFENQDRKFFLTFFNKSSKKTHNTLIFSYLLSVKFYSLFEFERFKQYILYKIFIKKYFVNKQKANFGQKVCLI
jgi:hypothetical protein